MKKNIFKVFVVLASLFMCSLSFGQSSKKVDEVSVNEFISIISNHTDTTFYAWFEDNKQTRRAIEKLDSILSLTNFYTLQQSYDNVASTLHNDSLQLRVDTTTLHFNNSKALIRTNPITMENRQRYRKSNNAIQKDLFEIRGDLIKGLIILCRMHSESKDKPIKDRLSHIKNRETARDLHTFYLEQEESGTLDEHPISPFEIRRNLALISDQLYVLDNDQFMLYASYTSTPKKFKSIELNHGNDIFTDFNAFGLNQDREMTGSFRLSITTDYFKARWLNIGKLIANMGKENFERNIDVLSYQTISFGGVGFTPYIRYQDNIELADTFHKYDRPFGSFVYLSRSKNRIWQKGLARHMGEFQVGFVGLEAPDAVQASLHKDFITSSQRVHGWDKQIGYPGRLAFQLNHDFDFLMLSNTNKYRGLLNKKQTKATRKVRDYSGANLIGSLEGKFGSYMTAFGAGARYSTLDFMKQSGQHIIVSNAQKHEDLGIHFETGIRYRRVIHNAMLEGIGFLKPFDKDSFDVEPINAYILSGNTAVQRNMFYWDWKVVVRCRKMAFYLQQTYHNLEYNVQPFDASSPEAYALLQNNPKFEENRAKYYNKTTKAEYKSLYKRGWYGYGTIGMTWLIE